jgi:hypothetical protein
VPEAPLRETKFGLVADVDGWFVVNAREARWRDSGPFGVYCDFEGKRPFRQLGANISVLEPGQSLGYYHRENAGELPRPVGSCVLIVEDESGARCVGLRALPTRTLHMIVGAGEGLASSWRLVRGPRKFRLPSVRAARKHGVSVDRR